MRRLLAFLAAFAFLAPAARAEDKQPGLEFRVKSVTDLTAYFEYFGGLAGKAEEGKQFADLVKTFGGEKGVVEGVDLKKPIGGYAMFANDIAASQMVVMVPVADEKAFIELLKNRARLDPDDQGDGLYKLVLPNVPPPFFFRIHAGYACITALDAKHIDTKNLIDPAKFFDVKDDSLLAISLHLDRIPAELKKVFLGEFELKLSDGLKNPPPKDAGEKLGRWLAYEGIMRSVKCLNEECKTLTLRLRVDTKSDDLSLTATLSAKDGSDFQKVLQSLPAKPALASLAANAENPIVAVAVNAGLPPAMLKDMGPMVDAMMKEVAGNVQNHKEEAGRFFAALAPTLKAGELELGVAVTGQPRGKMKVATAMKGVKVMELDNTVREMAGFMPADKGKIELDVTKIASGKMHKVTVKDEDFRKQMGTDSVWLGLTDKLLVAGIEEDGAEAKRLAALTPGKADMLNFRLSATRAPLLFEATMDEKMVSGVAGEVFGDAVKPGADEIKLTVTGGEVLTINLNVKGKAIEFFAKLDEKKKGN